MMFNASISLHLCNVCTWYWGHIRVCASSPCICKSTWSWLRRLLISGVGRLIVCEPSFVSTPNCFLLSVNRVQADGEQTHSSQSVDPSFAPSTASARRLSGGANGSMEADDRFNLGCRLDATQGPILPVAGIKAYLSPGQDAISGPHSPKPRDAISASLSPVAKDAPLEASTPHPQIAVSRPNSPLPLSPVLEPHSALQKDAVSESLSLLPQDEEMQKAGMEQQGCTPPRQERLQGNWSTV